MGKLMFNPATPDAVINNLTSDSTTDALSAAQGKALNTNVTSNAQTISNIATVITGTTNNSGHAISSGEYFIANGAKYKATATIAVNGAWANSAQSVSDHDLINALNGNFAQQMEYGYNNSKHPDVSFVSCQIVNKMGNVVGPFNKTWSRLEERKSNL